MAPVISHPLYFQFRWLCNSSLQCVREQFSPTFGITFLDQFRGMTVNSRGSSVGPGFQDYMTRWLNQLEPRKWRKGEGSEPDVVCVYNPDWSFEIKTSANTGNSIKGNRVQASANQSPCYLLYVNYYPDTLTIRNVRLGWVGPEDWCASSETSSQSAHVAPSARAKFVDVPDNMVVLAHAATCPNIDHHN